jgi:uncharacterized protein (DUF2252 family)
MERLLREQFRAYRATLRDDHRHLLERFQPVDMARKVVGVGSVGTLAYIVLLQVAIRTTRCSCSSRRQPPRSWRLTSRPAGTGIMGSGWSVGSG